MAKDKKSILLSAIKMKNLGEKSSKDRCCPTVSKGSTKIFYPNLYIEKEGADSFMDKDLGKSIKAIVSAVVTSKSMRETGSGGKKNDVSLEVKEIGLIE